MPLTGAGVLPGTVVTGFAGGSGGGAGMYTVGVLQTVPPFSATNAAGTSFSGAISGTTLTVTAVAGGLPLGVGSPVTGPGVLPGTVVTGVGAGTNGGAGTYTVGVPQTVPSTSMDAGALPSGGGGDGEKSAGGGLSAALIGGASGGGVLLLVGVTLVALYVAKRRRTAAAALKKNAAERRRGVSAVMRDNPLRAKKPPPPPSIKPPKAAFTSYEKWIT
jgi:hypothetical protein